MKPNKGVVIFGAIMLVGLQISSAWDLFEKAKIQNWRHFWMDLAALYVLALITGGIIVEAAIYRKRKRP